MNHQIDQIIDFMQEISGKLISIESKLSSIESNVSSTASNTDWLDTRLEDIKNSLDAIG